MIGNKPSIYNAQSVYNQGGGDGLENPICIDITNSDRNDPCYINDVGFFVRGTTTNAGFSPKLQITEFSNIEINLHVYIPPHSTTGVTGLITKAPTASHFIQLYYTVSAVGLRINNSFVNEFPKVIVDKESRIKITYNKTTRYYLIYIDDVLLADGTTIDFTGRDICVAFGFRDGTFGYQPRIGTIYYKEGTNIIVDGRAVFKLK